MKQKHFWFLVLELTTWTCEIKKDYCKAYMVTYQGGGGLLPDWPK